MPAKPDSDLDRTKTAPRRVWRRDTIVYAVLAQAILLGLTVVIVVVAPGLRDEPEFSSHKTIYLPQRELEHRVAVAEFQQAAAQPLQLEKLVTSALLPPDLPALPTVPRTDFNPLESSEFLSRDAQALLSQSGLMGAVGGLRTAASTAAFFGIEESGERIVIVVNTSVSVRNKAQRRGVPWDRVQAEAAGLIDGLGGGTQFGIVQFSQGVRYFAEFLAPATEGNRAAAREWMWANLRGNPPVEPGQQWLGHEAAMEAAFRLQPDVIFLVTDGVLFRREDRGGRVSYPEIPYDTFRGSVRAFQRSSPREARIHVVGFELKPSDAVNMRALVREYRGQLREF
jgi:hypothetical protein